MKSRVAWGKEKRKLIYFWCKINYDNLFGVTNNKWLASQCVTIKIKNIFNSQF